MITFSTVPREHCTISATVFPPRDLTAAVAQLQCRRGKFSPLFWPNSCLSANTTEQISTRFSMDPIIKIGCHIFSYYAFNSTLLTEKYFGVAFDNKWHSVNESFPPVSTLQMQNDTLEKVKHMLGPCEEVTRKHCGTVSPSVPGTQVHLIVQ